VNGYISLEGISRGRNVQGELLGVPGACVDLHAGAQVSTCNGYDLGHPG